MSSADFNGQEQLAQTGESRATLLAAAAFVEQWVRTQRASRTDLLPTLATVNAQSSAAFSPAPLPPPVPAPPALRESPPATFRAPAPAPVPVVAAQPSAAPAPEAPPLPAFDESQDLDLPPFEEPAAEWVPEPFEETPLPEVPAPVVEPAARSIAMGTARSGGGLFKLAALAASVVVLTAAGWGVSRVMSRPSAPKTGTVVLESTPGGATVLIDGAEAGVTPLTQDLAAGKHAIEFRRGDTVRKYDVQVVRGQQSVTNVDWGARRTGTLQVESTPTGAKVQIDGRDYGVTPTTVKDLVAGSHTMVLTTPEGSVRRSVTIAEDQTSQVSTAIFSGFLHVSSPIELQISEGRQVVQLDARSQALLKPGAHQLRFVNRALGFAEVRTVEIKPGDVTSISIEPKMSTISVTSSAPAEVFVDGVRLGGTPLAAAPIRVGTRDIVVKNGEGERRRTITVLANQPAQLAVDFSAP